MSLREPFICRTPQVKIKGSNFGSSVALTGDWHISPIVSEKQFEMLKKSFSKIKPELIILQGDLLDSPKQFDNEESVHKLKKWFKMCVSIAPTVMVLGGHDFIIPKKRDAAVDKNAASKWQKICDETGVKLLMDEWFETKNIRVFGMYQDEEYILTPSGMHKNNPKIFEKKLLQLLRDGSISENKIKNDSETNSSRKLLWFVSHGPEMTKGAAEILARRFDVVSFGHTHGGCVPIVADSIVDKLHLHGGVVSPTHTPLPRNVRGVKTIGTGSDIVNTDVVLSKTYNNQSLTATKIINPGMVAVQNCAAKPLHYLNFLKSAEVTWVKI